MSNTHGTPIWYELMASGVEAASAFYAEALGWSVAPFGNTTLTGQDYRIFTAPDGAGVAGMMMAPAQMPGPAWFGYIGVEDVDAAAADVAAAGGAVHLPPTTLEGVGRMAMVADPQGAIFYLMRGFSPESSTAFRRGTIGHGEWNELATSDDAAALAFYGKLFGWKKDGAMPMGEGREYSFLSHDGGVIGALMLGASGTQPHWTYYFRVGGIDETKARIEAAGGTVESGPHQVPGGDWIVVARDPQGACFGAVGSR